MTAKPMKTRINGIQESGIPPHRSVGFSNLIKPTTYDTRTRIPVINKARRTKFLVILNIFNFEKQIVIIPMRHQTKKNIIYSVRH